jgi:polar amino acid transport system ATP-binding protein
MTDAVVRAENVYTRFGRLEVLRGVSLEVAPREVLCVIGHSGSASPHSFAASTT